MTLATAATLLLGYAAGWYAGRDRNEIINRHRARRIRKANGVRLWWLLLPGWRYRS